MTQWARDRAVDKGKYPDERWIAGYALADRELVLKNDHHTVWIAGRRALLLSYVGAEDETLRDQARLRLVVSFTYPQGHPSASVEAQALVDRLTFRPCEG